MKNCIVLFVLFAIVGCTDKSDITAQNLSMYHSPLIDSEVAMDHPYELSMRLKPAGVNEYSLITSMKLFGGSFFVSPLATGGFSGKFTVTIEENNHLKLGDEIIETPRSKEVFDPHPFVKGKVNWVQTNTKYDYAITVTNTEDFKVSGWVRFTIEPKCTYAEIPFDVFYENGELRVQQYPKLDKRTCDEFTQ